MRRVFFDDKWWYCQIEGNTPTTVVELERVDNPNEKRYVYLSQLNLNEG